MSVGNIRVFFEFESRLRVASSSLVNILMKQVPMEPVGGRYSG